MSYSEKRTLVSILTGALILIAYCLYAFAGFGPEIPADSLPGWAATMLVFIGIGIVAAIVIQIVFHVLYSIGVAISERHEAEEKINRTIEASMVEDEMDRLIELKSSRVSFACAGIGFIAALVCLAIGTSAVIALNIMFLSFSAGAILEGFAQLYFYRKGIRHA